MNGSFGSPRHHRLLQHANFVRRHGVVYWSVITLLIILATLAVLLMPILSALWASDDLDADDSVGIIMPGDQALQALNEATEAERKRIAELEIVRRPPPHSMPVMVGRVPGLPDNADFTGLVRHMREIGCVDRENQVNVREDLAQTPDGVAELAIRLDRFSPGAQGLSLMRKNYHKGLLALCIGDAADALRAFRMVADQDDDTTGALADQFRFLGIAGQRLAMVQTGAAERVDLPALPDLPSGLSAATPCTSDSRGDECHLFVWPPVRSDLSRVHEFLARRDAEVADFRQSINNGYNSDSNLDPYNYFVFVAAYAKAGEFSEVKALAENARNYSIALSAENATCRHLNRIQLLDWIAGGSGETQPECGEFWQSIGRSDRDLAEGWEDIHALRKDIFAGEFVDPEALAEEPFVAEVRRDLMASLADGLRAKRSEAEELEDTETAERIGGILRTSYFAFDDRLREHVSILAVGLLAAFAIIILAIAVWVRRVCIGYSLAFPSRYRPGPQQ